MPPALVISAATTDWTVHSIDSPSTIVESTAIHSHANKTLN